MNPRLVIDKSAIQMMGADAFDEMTMWFDVVATPTLVHELIANLKRTNPLKKGKRLPIDVLRSAAALLSSSHAEIPASFRKLAIGSIVGQDIPMNGVTIPMDTTAENVHGNAQMLVVETTKNQELFATWARGEFKESDERVAMLWQSVKENFDMKAIGEQQKPFARRIAGNAKSIEQIIVAVDALMSDRRPEMQVKLCRITLAFLREDGRYGTRFEVQSALQDGLLFRTFAPYAASILCIYLVFYIALGLDIVKRDANSLADLQYLFYVPFCTGFCSNDKLHERLFPAVGTSAVYLPAENLKADLLIRKAWRVSLGEDGWNKHRSEYGFYPMEFEGSLINEVWKRTMNPRPSIPHRVTRVNLEKVQNDPKIWEMMDAMKKMVEKSKSAKHGTEMAWPHGDVTGGEKPFQAC